MRDHSKAYTSGDEMVIDVPTYARRGERRPYVYLDDLLDALRMARRDGFDLGDLVDAVAAMEEGR